MKSELDTNGFCRKGISSFSHFLNLKWADQAAIDCYCECKTVFSDHYNFNVCV